LSFDFCHDFTLLIEKNGSVVDLYSAAGAALATAKVLIEKGDFVRAQGEHQNFSVCITRINELCLAIYGEDAISILPKYKRLGWLK
jgi:hypothetical protein